MSPETLPKYVLLGDRGVALPVVSHHLGDQGCSSLVTMPVLFPRTVHVPLTMKMGLLVGLSG